MIVLLVVQIVAVYFWGVEPARRSLEGLDPKAAFGVAGSGLERAALRRNMDV